MSVECVLPELQYGIAGRNLDEVSAFLGKDCSQEGRHDPVVDRVKKRRGFCLDDSPYSHAPGQPASL
jgi:hypothetical protein